MNLARLGVLAFLILAAIGAASGKSLYVIDNINSDPTPISAYAIDAVHNRLIYQPLTTCNITVGEQLGWQ